MKEHDPVSSGEMFRIPGLYRRWELPEILKNHRTYRIEKAGAHQDGTPLVAIYADRKCAPGTSSGTDA
ncbi:hypothetical protein H1W37_03615 [Stappia taiwanensis]|uniref:Uncharacterized protein n=2 Tax=Stappia taiwanensis TaxID=992267 RepID=A0A838XQ58_9HYPH|nr:hypothetical protein [Stappia taiwanensis]MBA4610726.1 hypothetical protein [Stappia taiwanensis]